MQVKQFIANEVIDAVKSITNTKFDKAGIKVWIDALKDFTIDELKEGLKVAGKEHLNSYTMTSAEFRKYCLSNKKHSATSFNEKLEVFVRDFFYSGICFEKPIIVQIMYMVPYSTSPRVYKSDRPAVKKVIESFPSDFKKEEIEFNGSQYKIGGKIEIKNFFTSQDDEGMLKAEFEIKEIYSGLGDDEQYNFLLINQVGDSELDDFIPSFSSQSLADSVKSIIDKSAVKLGFNNLRLTAKASKIGETNG